MTPVELTKHLALGNTIYFKVVALHYHEIQNVRVLFFVAKDNKIINVTELVGWMSDLLEWKKQKQWGKSVAEYGLFVPKTGTQKARNLVEWVLKRAFPALKEIKYESL